MEALLPGTADGVEDLDELAANARAGCLVSYEKIVLGQKDRLFTWLWQTMGNAHDAEEVAQETFIKAWRHLDSFDGRARFSTWLFAIAKNTAMTHLRKRRAHDSIDEVAEVLPAPSRENRSDTRESIWMLARTLKPMVFECLWLFYAEGFSLKEIAQITHSNPITVRVNLHRGRAALKRKCEIHGIEP